MDAFKVVVRDIPREGLDLVETVSFSDLGLKEEEFKILSPLAIRVHLEKVDGAVLAQSQVKAKYAFSCTRCLSPIEQDRADRFELYFELDPAVDVIDVGEELRQEMILGIPQFCLCKEDCKGICPQCGVNLNETTCSCQVDKKSVIRGSELLGDEKPGSKKFRLK